MAKTGKQIQGDVYRLLRDSVLYTQISGEVYRNGYRPRDSRKEDAVVIFTAGLPDEIQTGVVTVNLYVPDIDCDDNGTWIEDGARVEELEGLAQEWVDSLSADVSCYKFRLQSSIYSLPDPDINQHFVVIKLGYEYFGNDSAPLRIPQSANISVCGSILDSEEGDELIIEPTSTKL